MAKDIELSSDDDFQPEQNGKNREKSKIESDIFGDSDDSSVGAKRSRKRPLRKRPAKESSKKSSKKKKTSGIYLLNSLNSFSFCVP